MNICKYDDKYYLDLKEVCYKTASSRYKEDIECLYALYLDYYLKYEKDNCFIIVKDDKAVGYILSALDNKAYYKRFKKEYLLMLKQLNKKFFNEAKGELFLNKIMAKKYTSHLHIDILPEFQHIGLGRKLIENLSIDLKIKGSKGIYLSCGYNNKNAIEFYKKVGFNIYFKSKFTGVIFTKMLGD